jgi:hypothetical protein
MGGIIALGLGLGMTPRQIVEFYTELGPRVFRDRSRLRGLRRLVRAKYAAGPLRAALTEVFGQRRFGESTKRLVICSYNLGSDDVYLFRTPHLPHLKRDWRERAVDVAMATAAAPTYLPGMPLSGTRLVDGGVWANNPAMVAVTEAAGPLGVPLDRIGVFSLGTTTDVPHRGRRLDRGGLLPWARDAVEVLMRAQSTSANNQVHHLIGAERLLRLNPIVLTSRTPSIRGWAWLWLAGAARPAAMASSGSDVPPRRSLRDTRGASMTCWVAARSTRTKSGPMGTPALDDPGQPRAAGMIGGEGQEPGQAGRRRRNTDLGQHSADRAQHDSGVGVYVRVDRDQGVEGFCEDGHTNVAPSG